jgi:triosephosphate isomerase (TIM)
VNVLRNARPLVAGNWKMHKTIAASTAFVRELLALEPNLEAVDAVVFPPFTALSAVGEALTGSALGLGGQTMSDCDSGACTGEISPLMLLDCGAHWVILGHSECRANDGETDAAVNRKVHAALRLGITPIVAVGESAADHAAGRTHDHVIAQTNAAFDGVTPTDVARCVVAYEPIWAIGTGLSDSPLAANDVMAHIRGSVAGLEQTRILYGGSVKPDNIGAFVAQPHIDGALVGGASLNAQSFADLIANARLSAGR